MRTFAVRAALSVLCLFSSPAFAADARAVYEFNLPEQTLSEALKAIGRQTTTNILFDPESVRDKTAPALRASLTVRQAIEHILQGTDLIARQSATDTLLVQPSSRSQAPRPVVADPQGSNRAGQNADGARRLGEGTAGQSFWSRFRLAQADGGRGVADAGADSDAQASSASSGHSVTPVQLENVVLPEVLIRGSTSLNMDIRRSRDDAQPYVIFERVKLEQSGAQNVEAFLRDRLSMNASGMANGQRVTQLGNQSTFNLRGLGSGQTLILIDGHRLAPGPASGGSPLQSDINNMPMSAVERIEVLPATASGIYGGGATGGVINIVLRRDYSGTEVKAAYGNTFASDVASRQFDLSTGFSLEGGKTQVMLMSSYSDQNPLTLQERESLVERYYSIARANAPASLRPPNNAPLGSTPNIRSVNGSNLVLRDNTPLGSSFTHIPVGYAGTATDNGRALVANAGSYNLDLANSTQHITGRETQIATDPRNISVRATLRREFSPKVQAFLEATGGDSETVGPAPNLSGTFLRPYRVSASARNNPFTTDIFVTVPTDSLPGSLETLVSRMNAIGGVIVELPAKWRAEADYTWARTRLLQGGMQSQSTGADTSAVLSGAVDVLRDTQAYPIDLSPLQTPVQIRSLQYIDFRDAALRFAGPVLDLPAGPLGVSALLEYRNEKYSDTTSVTSSATFFFPGRSGSVSSAYVETKVPLFSAKNRRPGVEELEVQLAARMDEYRTVGRTGFVTAGSNAPIVTAHNETRSTNPTVAVRYQPISDIVLRLSYGTGFVAPNVGQLAPSISASPVTFFDPRRGNASTTLAVGQALQGGNPDLGPEKSRSTSLGFVLTPRFAPGLRLSLDYTRIEKTDNISSYPTGAQGLVNDEALFPSRIRRGPNLPGDPAGWPGPITFLDGTLFNIASAEVEAFDMQLDYERRTRLGTFAFSGVATRQTHYLTRSLAGQPELENVGRTYTNPRGFTGSAELSWRHRGWTAGWLARYYDDYLTADPTLVTTATVIALQGNGGRVPSQTYHDLFVNWLPEQSGWTDSRIFDGTELRLSIRNVLDEMPPFDANVYNIFKTFHSPLGDPLGTTWQLAITKRFGGSR